MDLTPLYSLIREPSASIGALLVGALLVFVWVARTPWFIGCVGELKVRFKIDFELDGRTYHACHDVTLPTPDGTTQIDHVLVSRHGIFVIETKNMKGAIYGGERDRTWTQAVFRRRYAFFNPLRQNYKHVKAVEAVLGLERDCVHSVVVFAGRATFESPMPENVVGIHDFIQHVRSKSLVMLEDADVRAAVLQLKRSKISFPFARWIHLRNLRRNRQNPLCPACGRGMILRTAQRGANQGGQFWGCGGYPACKSTKQAPNASPVSLPSS